MLSSLGDIVCTSIIEIIEIFRALVCLLKISAKTRRGRGRGKRHLFVRRALRRLVERALLKLPQQ